MTKISEATAYTRSLVGKRVDHDGYYGAQCVDLIMHLSHKYFGMTTWGNAIDYKTNNQPNGTQRLYEIDKVQPMDVFVIGGAGGYGHIGVVVDVNGDKLTTVEQNLAFNLEQGSPAQYRTWDKFSMAQRLVCLIRWPFENDLQQIKQNVRTSGGWELIKENGQFTVTVDAINVRTAPSLDAEIVAQYVKGETLYYDHITIVNGFVWLSYIRRSNGQRAYMACRERDDNGKLGQLWGVIK
ncbi:CHAP domain-containing protein [Carnobacteriaceae bacterium zg-ZUI252]|nr:CHAP domain-containing protein [Carnobacteriaceae bacterium zg-ZUI252]